MLYGNYTKHNPGEKTDLQAYAAMVSHLSNGYSYEDAYWVCYWQGQIFNKRSIASRHCAICGGRLETIPHLLWTCSFTTSFVQRLSSSLSHRFLGRRFGKHSLVIWTNSMRPIQQCLFYPVDKILGTLTIWTARNNRVFHGNQQHEVTFCKQSLRQSLFDCLQLRDITLQIYNLYFECF